MMFVCLTLFTQISQTVHLKWVNLIVCKLVFHNKAVKKIKQDY